MNAIVVAAVCSAVMTSAALAASVTVSDKAASLAGVAAATTGLLLDAGLKAQAAGGGIFVVEVKTSTATSTRTRPRTPPACAPGCRRSHVGSTRRTSAAHPPARFLQRGVRWPSCCRECRVATEPAVRRSPTAAWVIAASSPNRSGARSTPGSTISAMAGDGAASLRMASKAAPSGRGPRPAPACATRPLTLCQPPAGTTVDDGPFSAASVDWRRFPGECHGLAS
jgi:hypothetical protein